MISKKGTTITQMLQCFDIESKRMAIEINGHVVKGRYGHNIRYQNVIKLKF